MFSFKRDAKVYMVTNDVQYNIDISEITFAQDIADSLVDIKTMQSQEMFAKTVVTAFKPATFNITFPALRQDDFQTVFDRALDYQVFDLYIATASDTFKLEGCVITNTTFIVLKTKPLSLGIAGEGSKLSREGDGNVTIPGTVHARSGTRTYNTITYLDITLGGVPTLDYFKSVSIELQTQIDWNPYETLGEVCGPEGELVYPGEFSVSKRVLSGTLTSHRIDPQTWSTDTSLYMEIGQKVEGTLYGFIFDLDSVSFTSRVGTTDIYTHSYDWRLTQNPDALAELIEYITDTTDESNAILDSWGIAILDSDGLPILDSL
jgi:hypothetical protein